jgi:tetratricopeptide (TPR) repeat protein
MSGSSTPGDPLAPIPEPERIGAVPGGAQVLGRRWRVQQVHHGGMAEVYICALEQPDADSEIRLALKTYPRQMLLNPAVRRAFTREVATWAQLTSHPGVVPMLGIEEIDGRLFAVSAAVPPDSNGDVSVRDLINRGPLPTARVLDIAWQAAATLANLGRELPGLVHGDLKPENFLLWEGVTLLVADFGLSRGVAEAFGDIRLAATPAYLPPEARDTSAPPTVAGDVYAFGVTVREMLGSRPDTEPGGGHAADLGTKPDPGSGACRETLAELARWCTADDPVSRLHDFDAITGFLSARAPQAASRMVAGKFIGFASGGQAAALLRRATLDSTVRTLLGLGMTDLALKQLDSVPRETWDAMTWVLHGSALSVANLDIEALSSFDQAWAQLASDPAGAGEHDYVALANEHALSLTRVGRYDEAITLLKKIIGSLSGENLTRTAVNLAGAFIRSGDHQAAVNLMERLVAEGRGDEEARVWSQLGYAYEAAGEPDKAIAALRRAVARTPGDSAAHLALARALLQYQEDFDSAAPVLDLALQLATSFDAEAVMLRMVCAIVQQDEATASELYAMAADAVGAEQAGGLLRRAAQCLVPESPVPAGPADDIAGEPGRAAGKPGRAAGKPGRAAGKPLVRPGGRPEPVPPAFINLVHGADGLTSVDFYHDLDDPQFAELFAERLQQFSYEPRIGTTLRSTPFCFTVCPTCDLTVLTNRPADRLLRCRQCSQRSSIVPIRTPRTDLILTGIDRLLNRKPQRTDGYFVLGSLEPPEPAQVGEVTEYCLAAGFELISPQDPRAWWLRILNQSRRAFDGQASHVVYVVREYPSGSILDATVTPPDFESLISTLRLKFGAVRSLSVAHESRTDDPLTLIFSGDLSGCEALLRGMPPTSDTATRWVILARFSSFTGDYAGARRQAHRAVQLAPYSGDAWFVLGEAQLDLGQLTEAQESLNNAQHFDPSDAHTAAALARCHLLLGNKDLAREQAERAIALGFPTREPEPGEDD